MSNENESTPARRVDDTRPAGRIDWDDPTRTAGAAKGGNTILDGIPKYEWWLMDREDSCEYVKVADVEARLTAPTVHSTTAAEIRAICMIQPTLVERDADGFWSHPGIPNFDEDAKSFKAWLAAVELETTHKMLEWEDSDHPVYVSYFDNEDPSFAAWEPQPPAGEGWFTFSIHDTEDGPVWVWARRALAGQQVAQGEKGDSDA